MAYTRTATNTYNVRVRVDGVDPDAQGGGGFHLVDYPEHTIVDGCLRGLLVGNSDPGNMFPGADPSLDFYYFGAVAIAVRADPNAWIGPYPP